MFAREETRMSDSGPNPGSDEATPQGRRSWRRRHYVVDTRYQLRAGVLVGSVAIALLLVLNASLVTQSREPAPAPFAAAAGRHDGVSWWLLLLGSAVFVSGVVAIGVFESHRTAGAAFAIRRSVDQIREGRTGVRIRLRRGDHLQDLASSVNQLAESLDAERASRS
jgi:hypothetical protein